MHFSTPANDSCTKDFLQLKLNELANKISKYKTVTLRIARNDVWADTRDGMRRPTFDKTARMKIVFMAEEAIDGGGPFREFSRLVMGELRCKSKLFEGSGTSLSLAHNIRAYGSDEYRIAGEVIVKCLVQGGCAPRFLSMPTYDFLVKGIRSKNLGISDVVDIDLREIIADVRVVHTTYCDSCICHY